MGARSIAYPYRRALVAAALAGTIGFVVFLRSNEEWLQSEADGANRAASG